MRNDTTTASHRGGLGEPNRVKVGVSEAAVGGAEDVLVTSGLGSCLGVGLYHPNADIGGLLHAMLPESADHPGPDEKFVVEGIDMLIAQLEAHDVPRSGMRAKLAGASSMLDFKTEDQTVGEQNVEAAERRLSAYRIPIEAADTGGSRGRSLTFDPETGRLVVDCAGSDREVL